MGDDGTTTSTAPARRYARNDVLPTYYDGAQVQEFLDCWWPQVVLWAVRSAADDSDDGWATVQDLDMPLQGWFGHRWDTLGVLVGLGLVEATFRVPARSGPVETGLLLRRWERPLRQRRALERAGHGRVESLTMHRARKRAVPVKHAEDLG